jgi:hypothetical protein
MRGKETLRRKRTYPRVEMGGHHRAAVLYVPTVRGVDLEYLTAQYHNHSHMIHSGGISSQALHFTSQDVKLSRILEVSVS